MRDTYEHRGSWPMSLQGHHLLSFRGHADWEWFMKKKANVTPSFEKSKIEQLGMF